MIVVLWVIFTAVLPRLKPMFESAGNALPTPTAILVATGDFVSAYGWIILLLLLVAVFAFMRFLRKPAFRLRVDRYIARSRLTLQLPLQYEASRFCRNLQILLSGGCRSTARSRSPPQPSRTAGSASASRRRMRSSSAASG